MSEYPESIAKLLELKAILICKEHLERARHVKTCHISVRNLARKLSKKVPEVENDDTLKKFANDFLEKLPWAECEEDIKAYRVGNNPDSPARMIYSLTRPENYELPNMTIGSTHTSRLAKGEC